MAEDVRGIYWEAPEHNQVDKGNDWFWILGIVAVSGSVVSIIFNNVLFAIVILLSATAMFLVAHQKPRIIPFEVSLRGIRIENTLYPYATLESYYLDEENHIDPKLILKSKKTFMTLIVIPIPDEHIDDIEAIVSVKLPEEFLEEPLSHKLLEFFGF